MPSLLFTAGPLAGRRLELPGPVVLGRDEGADFVVDDPEISRRHAALRPNGDTVEVEDLGSLNGTWVNGSRIETGTKVLLAPGDIVQLGTSQLELAPMPASATMTVAASSPPPGPAQAGAVPADLVVPTAPAVHAMPAFTPPPPPAAQAIATRRLTPTVLAFAVVIATAVALVIYFAAR